MSATDTCDWRCDTLPGWFDTEAHNSCGNTGLLYPGSYSCDCCTPEDPRFTFYDFLGDAAARFYTDWAESVEKNTPFRFTKYPLIPLPADNGNVEGSTNPFSSNFKVTDQIQRQERTCDLRYPQEQGGYPIARMSPTSTLPPVTIRAGFTREEMKINTDSDSAKDRNKARVSPQDGHTSCGKDLPWATS